MSRKAKVLLVGSGGVGTLAAYNMEAGGLAEVTAVLRSNYDAVEQFGFTITSIDHGSVKGWRPSKICRAIPDMTGTGEPFDFMVVTTKNVADVPPTVSEIIAPAVTKEHTTILLLQNGLNIEKPLVAAFPKNVILSGVSLIGATEILPGIVNHDDHDRLIVGPFEGSVSQERRIEMAQRFVEIYRASGNVDVQFNEDVGFVRWRKLLYNACYNSVCAITRTDTSRMRFAVQPIDDLIRPLMWEIWHIAKAAGYELPEEQIERMIHADPVDIYFKPSMQQDIEKGNYMEFENIVGEPLREAERLGVPVPTLRVVYSLLKTLQWRIKESKGLVVLPPARGSI